MLFWQLVGNLHFLWGLDIDTANNFNIDEDDMAIVYPFVGLGVLFGW